MCPGSCSSRSTGSPAGPEARDADGQRAQLGALDRGGRHRLVEWETDLSSQTGASQAGILLGSNEDIPAFRWVEKETKQLMTCSAPPDCAEIERRRSTGVGLLANGGASRGNLLSGEADHVILTVSRIEAEKEANPGYRAFFANGYNVTRTLVLFIVGGHPRARRGGAPAAARRRAARPPQRDVSAPPRGALRPRPRPDRLRRPRGHDARPACDLRDLLELRRGRPPLGARARRHARGAPQARRSSSDGSRPRGSTRRGPTGSSSSPTTDRRRARRSASATGTASTTWFAARWAAAPSRPSPAATRTRRPSGRRSRRRRAERRSARTRAT